MMLLKWAGVQHADLRIKNSGVCLPRPTPHYFALPRFPPTAVEIFSLIGKLLFRDKTVQVIVVS